MYLKKAENMIRINMTADCDRRDTLNRDFITLQNFKSGSGFESH